MRSYRYQDALAQECSEAQADLLSKLSSDQQKLDQLRKNHPGLLSSMKERALIDNVDASARIEGIYLQPERIEELVAGATPTRGVEQQAAGYSRILKAIEQSPDFFTISPSTLLAMHTVLFTGEKFDTRSRYRRRDWADVVGADGNIQRMAISPIDAYETPLHLGALCDSLATAMPLAGNKAPLIISQAIVDFMCIRPFDKGDGRLIRLFSYLLLTGAGYDIPRYVSVDSLCEKDAMGYYTALNSCVLGWESGHANYEPFALYWMGKIHEAYAELLSHHGSGDQTAQSKADRIRWYFKDSTGKVTKKEIAEANPDISISTIENALHALLSEGAIVMVGSGRTAAYEAVRDNKAN